MEFKVDDIVKVTSAILLNLPDHLEDETIKVGKVVGFSPSPNEYEFVLVDLQDGHYPFPFDPSEIVKLENNA